MTSLDLLRGKNGGAERDRTAGLLVANEALSQLSYSPTTYLSYQRAAIPQSRIPIIGIQQAAVKPDLE